jgi:glyoxylase-like metal-dependent hydrolase (beta-lactamase superfamily II)
MDSVVCMDTKLSGYASSVASFLIPYSGGAVLVDTGSGSTQENLKSALSNLGLTPKQVTHVLLTHIHLDHAGAAGWLAAHGAQVFVHPVGVPHLLNPGKLIASARRIYGDKLEELWGAFLPVPAGNLAEVRNDAEIAIGELRIIGLHTPGHAEHHVAYVFQDTCFTGDVGGVRKTGPFYVRMPFVPPETHLGKWRNSLECIRQSGCQRLALSHFGIFADAPLHLAYASREIDAVEQWLETVMPEIPDAGTLQNRYISWLHERGKALGLSESTLLAYDFASPAQMGASGLFRYWHKVRMTEKGDFIS